MPLKPSAGTPLLSLSTATHENQHEIEEDTYQVIYTPMEELFSQHQGLLRTCSVGMGGGASNAAGGAVT